MDVGVKSSRSLSYLLMSSCVSCVGLLEDLMGARRGPPGVHGPQREKPGFKVRKPMFTRSSKCAKVWSLKEHELHS